MITVFYHEWVFDMLNFFLPPTQPSKPYPMPPKHPMYQPFPTRTTRLRPFPAGIFLPVFAGDDEGGRNQVIPQYLKLPLAKALAVGQGQ